MNNDLVLLFKTHIDLCNDLEYQIKILNNKIYDNENKLTRRSEIFKYLKEKEIKEEAANIKNKNYIKTICSYINKIKNIRKKFQAVRESCSTSCGYISVCIWSCVVRPCRCARPIACTLSNPIA